MPRNPHIPHPECPYHVTARSHSGNWFSCPIEIVWIVMSNYLYFIHSAYRVKIHAFVLMNNHFHMLVSTPEANLSEAMNYFMRETGKEINRISGNINQVYGNRYHRTLVDNLFYFQHVYKYIYRNPVTAGISESCEEYKFSTLRGLLGFDKLSIPVAEDTLLFENGNIEKVLGWLNTEPTPQNYETLRKSLQRKRLSFPRNISKPLEKKHTLETGRF